MYRNRHFYFNLQCLNKKLVDTNNMFFVFLGKREAATIAKTSQSPTIPAPGKLILIV